MISLLAGITFSHGTNFIKPLEYAQGDVDSLGSITLYFTRLVLGVQLVLAGVQLPSKYLIRKWRSLALLLGPGMTGMWLCSALLVWGLVPDISFLHSLAVAACVTPTDPVLSNSIVKGKFADRNIPKDLQLVIIAESGANDGLGYPFLFLALYIIKYVNSGGAGQPGGARLAMGYWFGETWGYTILLSVVYGAAVGWIAKDLLHFAEERKFVDRESFLVFAITLALFITGTCGMIGSDDVLACFIAGNAFTFDDWFRIETLDDSLQPTIDMLLNLSVFMWFGAVCPWYSFVHNDVIPIYRLIPLGILILLVRRVPVIFALHKKIPEIEEVQQALFVGFFGPIGVSAVFYLYLSLEFLDQVTVNGEIREDAARLREVFMVVVWFLAICSIVRLFSACHQPIHSHQITDIPPNDIQIVHGVSIPIAKLGYHLPRTISRSVVSQTPSRSRGDNQRGSEDDDGALPPFPIRDRVNPSNLIHALRDRSKQILQSPPQSPNAGTPPNQSGPGTPGLGGNIRSGPPPPREVFRIGGSVIRNPDLENAITLDPIGKNTNDNANPKSDPTTTDPSSAESSTGMRESESESAAAPERRNSGREAAGLTWHDDVEGPRSGSGRGLSLRELKSKTR